MNYLSTTNAAEFGNLQINTGENGKFFCYTKMLEKLEIIFFRMIQRHNKVLFIRFDLRFPDDYSMDNSNDKVSRLFKILSENATYKKIDFQFLWAREQSREKHQHYHCILLIDGNKVQKYYPVLVFVSKIWGRLVQSDKDGLVHYCDQTRGGKQVKNGIMLRRPSEAADNHNYMIQKDKFFMDFEHAFNWGSYLCKENQKANIPFGMRRFGVSQEQKSPVPLNDQKPKEPSRYQFVHND